MKRLLLKTEKAKQKNRCKVIIMPYTVKFLDDKLYQSLSFDADIKFESSTKYSKKIWILKNYKIQGGLLELTEAKEDIQQGCRPMSGCDTGRNRTS